MTTVQIELPAKLIPVFGGEADYRCSWGGRGSAKTKSFAKMAAVRGLMYARRGISGLIACGREIMKSLDESSFAEVKAAILSEPWLAASYEIGEKYIRTKGHLPGRVDFAFVGLRHNLASIKSKARILLLWVDEAEDVSDTAWLIVEGTLREEGDDWYAELWVTWNPEREKSATNKRFRLNPPPNWKGVEMNWRDNEFFPNKLNRTRLNHKENEPDDYDWVWEGTYRTHFKGAYFAAQAAVPSMQKRGGGAIVNIGTTLLEHAIAGFPASAALSSKAALHSLTEQLAAEFGNDNIRVSTVATGIVETPLHAKQGIEDTSALAGLHLLNRIGNPEDVADAVYMLATNHFISGTTLRVDGGHAAGHAYG